MNKLNYMKILYLFQQKYSKIKTALKFNSNFELLISVILSAQSTDISVNLVTKKLYALANTPEKMLILGKKKIKKNIKSLGLYNKKTNYIINTCIILCNKFGGEIPNNRIELESLPGVGRKTANIILNMVFGLPTIAVDTHVFRVSNRIGITKGKNVFETEKQLIKIIPTKLKYYFHNWLIFHGKYICLSKKPKCINCFISNLCEYKKIN